MGSQELSLNDVVMPKCYTRLLWVFDYQIEDLEKGFIEFLEKFCPQAFGHIIYDENKPNYGRLSASTLPSNRIFSRAEQNDTPISYYINCDFQELDVFPYAAIPTDTSPLCFLHQITVQNGTLLAFGIHHQFSDGHGFFNLIQRFANWIREKDDSKIEPFIFDRALLKPSATIRYEHIEYTTIPPSFSFTEIPAMDVIIRRYTKRELFAKLNITSSGITLNDVLVAWLTQLISQIRPLPSNEIVRVGMASNGRNELEIGSNYFGNCNFFVCVEFSMNDLMNKSVNELAEEINVQKKGRMTKDYMISALAWLKNATAAVHPGFQSFLGKDLAFTNWSRFPAYEIDFGQGPPRRILLPAARWDGLILILPTATDQVELYIGLKQEHANELLQRLA